MQRSFEFALTLGASFFALGSFAGAQTLIHDFVGETDREHFGECAATAGDVDGDSVPDVLIAGSGDGTFDVDSRVVIHSGLDWSKLYEYVGGPDQYGWANAGLGDVNGDGKGEFLIHDRWVRNITTYSGATGLPLYSVTWDYVFPGIPALAVIGDVNGDGASDFTVGEITSSKVTTFSGATGANLWSVTGAPSTGFGSTIHGGEDVDADGFPDLVVGVAGDSAAGHYAGAVRVYSGPTGFLVQEILGSSAEQALGSRVLSIHDLDSDGHAEIVAGYRFGTDRFKVFSGATSASLYEVDFGEFGYPGYADELAGVGDVDGNGSADFVVALGDATGRAVVFSGKDGRSMQIFSGGDGTGGGGDRLGVDVDGVGDIDLDGTPDLIIGADGRDDAGFSSGGATIWSVPSNKPHRFCDATVNSTGESARFSWSGSVHLEDENLALYAERCPPGQFGLFFYGATPTQVPFFDGVLCVQSPHFRLKPPVQIDASGTAAKPIDFHNPPAGSGPGKILVGSTWYFQFWFRDPAAGASGANTSDGLRVVFSG